MAGYALSRVPSSFRTEQISKPRCPRTQQPAGKQCTHQNKRRRTIVAQASAAGAGSFEDDPYKVKLREAGCFHNARTAVWTTAVVSRCWGFRQELRLKPMKGHTNASAPSINLMSRNWKELRLRILLS